MKIRGKIIQQSCQDDDTQLISTILRSLKNGIESQSKIPEVLFVEWVLMSQCDLVESVLYCKNSSSVSFYLKLIALIIKREAINYSIKLSSNHMIRLLQCPSASTISLESLSERKGRGDLSFHYLWLGFWERFRHQKLIRFKMWGSS